MKTIVTILGARPQFIKAAMVSRELANAKDIREMIIHTGQHYDANMSDVFFQEMNIPEPAINLGIAGGGHGSMTGRMMEKLEETILPIRPDLLMVYGDTNSTLAGALVASKLHIPIAHVEAGLRNFDLSIPEDVNRILTDRLSTLLFCPTDLAVQNLRNEGYESFGCRIIKTGDLMVDAAMLFAQKTGPSTGGEYVLCTIHREHNTVEPGIHESFAALNEIGKRHRIVFPIHPRTEKALKHQNIKLTEKIETIPPQGYLDMIRLLKGCSCVITDSGGLQKEAYAVEKKSLLLMDYTPWEELVTNGFSLVTEIDRKAILEMWEKLSSLKPDFGLKLYGNGNTGAQIVEGIMSFLSNK